MTLQALKEQIDKALASGTHPLVEVMVGSTGLYDRPRPAIDAKVDYHAGTTFVIR